LPAAKRSLRPIIDTLRVAAVLVGAALAGACSSDSPTAPATGSLAVAVEGLPSGAEAAIMVTGSGGFARSISGSQTLEKLAAGTYTVTAGASVVAGVRYMPDPSSQTMQVSSPTPATAHVGYAVSTGALAVAVTGLPAGAPATVTVSGPAGYSRTVAATETVLGLDPGTYQISASAVGADGGTWTASASPAQVDVVPSLTPTAVQIAYAIATGSIAVSILDAPAGTTPAVTVTGPGNYSRVLTASATITNLTPGTYTVSATPLSSGTDIFAPATLAQSVNVAASLSPAAAEVRFGLATGRLTVNVTGLPTGATAAVTVTGPAGYSKSVTASQTLTGLQPGGYTVAAAKVTVAPDVYAATPATQQITVSASSTPFAAAVAYALASGSLALTVSGLPNGTAASIAVTGPGGFAATPTASATMSGLAPGAYLIVASSVTAGAQGYAPTPATQTITIAPSLVPIGATVAYAPATGGLTVTITGLPGATSASVQVTGPGGYAKSLGTTTTLNALLPGTYSVSAAAVSAGGTNYQPSPASQNVTVTSSTTPATAAVAYAASSGGLTVTVTGLPPATPAAIAVTGPGSYSAAVTATQTLSGLAPGSYSLAASTVSAGGTSYTAAPASQSVSVTTGAVAGAAVTYSAVSSGPNLSIDGMYITQSVQTYAGTVPLVAGRTGFLRVFVKANAANSLQPSVRVRFYIGAALQSTITINAPGASVPTTINEGSLASSWNAAVPAALIQPGIKVLADVDPTNAIAESNEADNSFPVSGTPVALTAQAVPSLDVTFVPVKQQADPTLIGNVTSANKDQFLTDAVKMYPLLATNTLVHAVYTTADNQALQSNDGNGEWLRVLSEMNALRAAEGSSRHYYGVVKVSYSSGIAGYGYVPGGAAVGWDNLPSGTGVAAHELGHNFSRAHAPCGGAGGPDPNFPYSGGTIGVYGYDVAAASLKAPGTFDLMGYCSPSWISDYTYTNVLSYRSTNPDVSAAAFGTSGGAARVPQRSLLVWGRIERGTLILEPAFVVNARPSLPHRRGALRIEGVAGDGRALFSYAFDGDTPADVPDQTARHFAFAIPLSAAAESELAELRLSGSGRSATTRISSGAGVTSSDTVETDEDVRGELHLRWNAQRHPMALVRDRRTGQVLSFARGGVAQVRARSDEVEVLLSDGVRSSVRPMRARQK
jgi:hypothetical protein